MIKQQSPFHLSTRIFSKLKEIEDFFIFYKFKRDYKEKNGYTPLCSRFVHESYCYKTYSFFKGIVIEIRYAIYKLKDLIETRKKEKEIARLNKDIGFVSDALWRAIPGKDKESFQLRNKVWVEIRKEYYRCKR